MVTSRHKASINQFFQPMGRALAKLGFTPNSLTLIGLGLTFACCLYLVLTKNVFVFCIVVVCAALFDALDGAVARATNTSTPFGAYLDAICDRFSETSVALTVAWVTGYWLPSVLVIIGVMAISYGKARAAMEVKIDNLSWPDLLEKGERGVFYIVGLFISTFFTQPLWGESFFYWWLWILVAGVYFTVIQRTLRAKRYIEAKSK